MNNSSTTQVQENIQSLLTWSLPFIICLGLVGNTISFVVLTSSKFRSVPIYFFLSLLAVADSFVLILSAFKTLLRLLTGFELLHWSEVCCKLLFYLTQHFQYLSSWFLVLVTFDRCVAVCASLKSNVLLTIRRARIAAVILNIIVFALNAHLFVNYELTQTDGRFSCRAKPNPFSIRVFPLLKLWTYSLIPIILVLCMNAAIMLRLLRGTAFDELRSNSSEQTRRRNIRVVVMLLLVTASWIIFTCPLSIWLLVADRSPDSGLLIKTWCFLLMYLNHATNFIFYCLNGNKFRHELKRKFTCRKELTRQDTFLLGLRS